MGGGCIPVALWCFQRKPASLHGLGRFSESGGATRPEVSVWASLPLSPIGSGGKWPDRDERKHLTPAEIYSPFKNDSAAALYAGNIG